MPITFFGLQEPKEPRMMEGVQGTLCALDRPITALGQAWPRALVPLRNGHLRAFPASRPEWPGRADSGGPSLPSGSLLAGTAKSLRITTLRLLTLPGPLVPLDPGP